MQGREIYSLYNGSMESGNYIVDWDASDFSSGIYFVKMISNDFVITHKIMLIK